MENTIWQTAMASGTTGAVVILAYAVWKIFKRSHCVAHCCGNDMDIETGTKEPLTPKS